MGLSHVLAGFFLAMVLIVMFSSFAYSMLSTSTRSYASFVELRKSILLDVNTMIRVSNFTVLSPTSLQILVENRGNSKVLLDDSMDVILDYRDDSGLRWTKELEYMAPVDGWSVSSIQGDYVDPNILNPGETAVLLASLSQPLQNGTLTVVVCARYGHPSQFSGRVGT